MAETGLKAVFLAQRPLLARLLRARLGSADEAEDVLQELWLRLETVRTGPVNDPLGYLMRMALNLAIDRSLSTRRRAAREQAWAAVQPAGAEIPGADAALTARDELAQLRAALAAMPPPMAEALLLFRVDGLPQREIAARLGMSQSGLEKLLARGYRRLAAYQSGAAAAPPRTTDSRGRTSDVP